MRTKSSRQTLQVVSGWEAIELLIQCFCIGAWQLIKISFKRLWKGHRRKYSKNATSVQLTVDSSIGTHYYIKVLVNIFHLSIIVYKNISNLLDNWSNVMFSVVRSV